ncbi:AAA family ATPase [Actinopolymorpha sp. B17G11]|uniref:AAA family ATPase n=1 Tax=Actinopolymorpha sp. B17G11 TaxID=3160861 RepID=UPI0032E42EFF
MDAASSRRIDPPTVESADLVGRRQDVAEIKDRLTTARLVTLTGVPGVGKTQLALSVVARLRKVFRHDIRVVELAPLRDGGLLAHTIAMALRMPSRPGWRPLEDLATFLQGKKVLLVVDNCEHLVDDWRQRAGQPVAGCTEVAGPCYQ